jgi:hypothetical protein
LADVQVQKTANFAHGVGPGGLLFDASNEVHLSVQVGEVLARA